MQLSLATVTASLFCLVALILGRLLGTQTGEYGINYPHACMAVLISNKQNSPRALWLAHSAVLCLLPRYHLLRQTSEPLRLPNPQQFSLQSIIFYQSICMMIRNLQLMRSFEPSDAKVGWPAPQLSQLFCEPTSACIGVQA
jgi:hypothetical protein